MGEGTKLTSEITVENPDSLRIICGPNDVNIAYLENLTGCRIISHGNRIEFSGPEDRTAVLEGLLARLLDLSGLMADISVQDILLEYKALSAPNGINAGHVISVGNRTIRAKGTKQAMHIDKMNRRVLFIMLFCLGSLFIRFFLVKIYQIV